MWNPWHSLKARGDVRVHWVRPHPLIPAATDGVERIWIDPRANQIERRCLLAHELIHLELSHRGCQPSAVERLVRAEAAHRLVTTDVLMAHLPWARSSFELAEELSVTELVLKDRLATLTASEHLHVSTLEFQTY